MKHLEILIYLRKIFLSNSINFRSWLTHKIVFTIIYLIFYVYQNLYFKPKFVSEDNKKRRNKALVTYLSNLRLEEGVSNFLQLESLETQMDFF